MIPGQICGQLPSIVNEKVNSRLAGLPQAIAVSQMLSMFGGALMGLGGPTPTPQYVSLSFCFCYKSPVISLLLLDSTFQIWITVKIHIFTFSVPISMPRKHANQSSTARAVTTRRASTGPSGCASARGRLPAERGSWARARTADPSCRVQ